MLDADAADERPEEPRNRRRLKHRGIKVLEVMNSAEERVLIVLNSTNLGGAEDAASLSTEAGD